SFAGVSKAAVGVRRRPLRIELYRFVEVGDGAVQLPLHPEDKPAIEMSPGEVVLVSLARLDDLRAAVEGLCSYLRLHTVTERVGAGWIGPRPYRRDEGRGNGNAGNEELCIKHPVLLHVAKILSQDITLPWAEANEPSSGIIHSCHVVLLACVR